ncbi:hypothetical protein LINPERPRIM_LOCUS2709, partial [Linum perenne]
DEFPAFEIQNDELAASNQRKSLSLILLFFGTVRKTIASLHSALGRLWGLQGHIRLFDVGHGLLQCYFESQEDRSKILRQQPWNLDGQLMHLQPWSPPCQELADSLFFMDVWVTMSNVPTEFTSVSFGRNFLTAHGTVLDVGIFRVADAPEDRIRGKLNLNLTKGLIGRRKSFSRSGIEFYVDLHYEGVPRVCYNCGKLDHTHSNCLAPVVVTDGPPLRGPWMYQRHREVHRRRGDSVCSSGQPPPYRGTDRRLEGRSRSRPLLNVVLTSSQNASPEAQRRRGKRPISPGKKEHGPSYTKPLLATMGHIPTSGDVGPSTKLSSSCTITGPIAIPPLHPIEVAGVLFEPVNPAVYMQSLGQHSGPSSPVVQPHSNTGR